MSQTGSRTSSTAPRRVPWLGGLTLVMLVVFAYLCFGYAPKDLAQGAVQRLFYPHVSSAWVAGLAFLVVFVSSVAYLVTRNLVWDARAAASAEVGLLFTTGTLALGMLWGKASWGAYWVWDPRLTAVLVLWLLYLVYMALRSYVDDPHRRARFSGVLGIVAFVDVPIIYFSVKWWRTQHPSYVIQPGMVNMPLAMLWTLLFGVATFTVLYIHLARQRMALQRLRQELAEVTR